MYCQHSHPFSNLCQLMNIVLIHVVMKNNIFISLPGMCSYSTGEIMRLQPFHPGQAYNLHQSESIVHPKLELFKNSPYRGES